MDGGEGKEPLSGFQTVLRNSGGPCGYCKVQPWGIERRAVPRCGGGGGGGLSCNLLPPPGSSLTLFPLQPAKLCLHVLHVFK